MGSDPVQTDLRQLAVLIPACNPDENLPKLARSLSAEGFGVVLIVDDGSAPASFSHFRAVLGCPRVQVLRHRRNRGRGCALKTGLDALLTLSTEFRGVVTADADGQHTPEDIRRVGEALLLGPERFVLGTRTRHFGTWAEHTRADLPWRNVLGDRLTQTLVARLYGVKLSDAHTGLRGFTIDLVPQLLRISGKRYEYEMSVLVHLLRTGTAPRQVPVAAAYRHAGRRSSFRPVRDSFRVSLALLRPRLRWKRGKMDAKANALRLR